jgi:hypothetical protein
MEKSLVKIDRTTAQDWLPILINKGLFSDYKNLSTRDEILQNAIIELGVEELTPAQEREALTTIGEYKTDRFIVRDYGRYSIGFDIKMHEESLIALEKKVTDDIDDADRLQIALSRISLYKLGHKLAMVILSEIYCQRTFKELRITKQTILSYLGYKSHEKQIYQDIDDAMFSLRYLNYVVYEYKNKVTMKQKYEQNGNFIYNLRQDKSSYTLWINEAFVGCIEHVLSKNTEKLDDEDKKPLFERGYFSYDTSLLSASRHYSTPGYLLSYFLSLDSGNAKLNDAMFKVVVYKASRFMKEAMIQYSRPSAMKRALIKAIEEVHCIDKMQPSVEELKQITPSMFYDTMIRIYIRK